MYYNLGTLKFPVDSFTWNCPFMMPPHGMLLECWNDTKSLPNIWQCFSCLLVVGIAKICQKWKSQDGLLSKCKIGRPIQPIQQQMFALSCSARKKQSWELNSLHIFEIPSSTRLEKCFQMLQRHFAIFHQSRITDYSDAGRWKTLGVPLNSNRWG